MSYTQARNFGPNKGGTKGGWCLSNVRLGYGIPALQPNAWAAWLNTVQHTGTAPNGVSVPLFYDWSNSKGQRLGHINVRLPDGRIWNDGRIFSSAQAFANYLPKAKYVGWGETLNGIRIVNVTNGVQSKGDDMLTNADTDIIRIINSEVEGYPFTETHAGQYDAQENRAWVGIDVKKLIRQKWNQGAAFRNARNALKANYDNLLAQLEVVKADANGRPSKAAYEAVLSDFAKANEKVLALEAKIKEPVDEKTVTTNYLKRKLTELLQWASRLFRKG